MNGKPGGRNQMRKAKNILFIMFDQLRWDYLSCYGHPHLHTPNIDRLAARGMRFNRAFIQSPLCGPSRMSTYTGRYVNSHGAAWNNAPLKVGERTMGDYLRDAGMDCWLVGKTHMAADAEGMRRLGLAPDSVIGARVAECGFDVFERDDGMRPQGPDGFYDEGGALKYNEYLRARGYDSDNPWHDFANSGIDDEGNVLSGWFLKNADEPANIAGEDSETPYLTRRGMAFMEAQGDRPWCCHLSYIKPHWPYIVPAPYHAMYGPELFLPPVRSQAEFDNAHPVFKGFMNAPVGRAFARDDVREKVLRAYMGLIKQCDDQMGVLFDWLEKTGRMKDTMIVVTSDHGDFLGDHWLGEKTFFHDASVKVPLIVYDPSPEADATRGMVCDQLVECIDLVPTFLEVAGGDPSAVDHILEGRSLVPLLHGRQEGPLRDHVICEFDYSTTPLADRLELGATEARMVMVADRQWKMIHFEGGFRPMLFDLENDPDELVDLGESAQHRPVIDRLYDALFAWARRPSQRTTVPNSKVLATRKKPGGKGVMIGVVDEADADPAQTIHYVGRKAPDKRRLDD
ncbi:MAG: sulfatase-like hydrolase/transferase [Zhengella sp.]